MCGKEEKPHVKMEVICDLDLYIWHLYFGLPGVLKDIDIMWLSPLMNAIKIGSFPPVDVKYSIGNEDFTWFYFLTDGIYPPHYNIFVQTITAPSNKKEKNVCSISGEC